MEINTSFKCNKIFIIKHSIHVKYHKTIICKINTKQIKIYKLIFYTKKKTRLSKKLCFYKVQKCISLTKNSGAQMYYIVEI